MPSILADGLGKLKRIGSLLALPLAFTAAAPAAAGPVAWQGEIMITAKSGPCGGVRPGDFAAARYRPGIGGENGFDSYVTLFNKREARGYKLAGNLFGNAFLQVETMYVGDVFAPFTITPVEVRFTFQQPAVVTARTIFIDVKGKIRGFDGLPGCTIDFKLTVARREN